MEFFDNISPVYASIAVAALPLLASLYQFVVGKREVSGNVSLGAILLSTIISILCVFPRIWNELSVSTSSDWFTIGTYTIGAGVLLNNLTVLMQLLICVIALPVHIYSRAYMRGDSALHRYWMYLSFFCCAMLALVISNSLLVMYVFWELVGFSSFLLIGFWYQKESAAQASKKAFIVNRIGDVGFLIGLGLMFFQFQTFNLTEIIQAVQSNGISFESSAADMSIMTGAGIAFLVAAMAKSAQVPLHVWLPDAMEGPTAVSSLIHAATMVAAGVFLLASVFPIFTPMVLLMIVVVGCVTALTAACFALAQRDIKKVLAYSTVSQLGFMFVGIGIGAWDAAIFHLVTHAFFKCLLFLCSGAVIHEMTHLRDANKGDFDPQDMDNMGGLHRPMRITFLLMTIAGLALAGFPLTSGYLSKDAIVISTFEWALHSGGIYLVIPIVLVIVSFLTAFYIGRLLFKTFLAKPRLTIQKENLPSLHDAPPTMWGPMMFLSLGSFFFVFGKNPFSYHGVPLLDGLVVEYTFSTVHSLHVWIPIVLTVGTLVSGLIGWRWYVKGQYPLRSDSLLIKAAGQGGYIDIVYQKAIVNTVIFVSRTAKWVDIHLIDGVVNGAASLVRRLGVLAKWIDKNIVDGIVGLVAGVAYYLGHLLRWVQNGRLQNYFGFAMTMVLLGIIYLIFIY